MSNEEMEKMQVAVERNGESAETVANRWIAENEQRWRPWLQE
jgi:ABC-type proline/glycine betaine transport system substrate-binding protein